MNRPLELPAGFFIAKYLARHGFTGLSLMPKLELSINQLVNELRIKNKERV